MPCFVVIKITPFAPLDPYIAVASASFNTSILSISAGLRELNGLIPPGTVSILSIEDDSKGTPSIIYNGDVPAAIEFKPRMLTLTPAPGVPDELSTNIPGIRPANA